MPSFDTLDLDDVCLLAPTCQGLHAKLLIAAWQILLGLMCSVYERAFRSLRENQPDAKEEAVMLLEAWRTFEANTVAAEQRQVSHALQLLPVAASQKTTDTMNVHTQLKQLNSKLHPCCMAAYG